MRRLVQVLAAATVLSASGMAHAQSTPDHPDAAAVQAWLAEYQASWESEDAERMYRASQDDVEWINIVGMYWRGKAQVVGAHDAFLTTMFRDTPMQLVGIESIRSVGDDALVVVARWSVGEFTTPAGHVIPPSQDRMTLVFERTPEGLSLAHAANIQIDQAAVASNPIRPEAD